MKFLVRIKNLNGSHLFVKDNRNCSLHLHIKFDQWEFMTQEDSAHNDGTLKWEFDKSFVFEAPNEDSEEFLEHRLLKISCFYNTTHFFGSCSVDLYTIATGPLEHNLPLLKEGVEEGRLSFSVTMEQYTLVQAHFDYLKINQLKPLEGHTKVHPYLRYCFQESFKKLHSEYKQSTVMDTENPEWKDLPDLEFLTSIHRLLTGGIRIDICHHGSFIDNTYAKVSILFSKSASKLVEPGHEFKFYGKIHYHDASVEGKLQLHNLPKYVQMIAHNNVQNPLQTETGIHNADFIAPGFDQPHVPIFMVDTDHVPPPHYLVLEVPEIESSLWKELHEEVDQKSKRHSWASIWKPHWSGYEHL